MNSEGVLLGDFVGVEFVAFIAAEFPDGMEVSPEFVDQFLGPGVAGVFVVVLAVAEVLLLVVDD